jgi:hypothetical protein
MCELAQGCSPLLLPLADRRCCCLELAAAAGYGGLFTIARKC